MACVESDYSMMRDESDVEDDIFDMSDEENVAPPSKGSKPVSKTSANVIAVLSPNKNAGNVPAVGNGKKKTVEQMYQKKTQLEHILIRPDTYIGSVEPLTQPMFVLDEVTNRIVNREITYTPGLYKIFDEILVNAADNKQRDPDMDKLDITVDAEANTISVKNNGKGIPVVVHKEHKCYVPALIFGHLLTGSNFDDKEKKTTGGRNGYGAKLANIFSTEFTVECLDSGQGLKFKQTFRNNMGTAEEPSVKKCTAAEKKRGDYTMITFSPDLARFNMTSLDKDTVGLLSKRAYDIAGSMANRAGKKLAVTLNGTKLAVKSFQDYLKLFDGINPPVAYEKFGERWEVGVSSTDGSPQQISFVNSICTSKGGGHVAYIADQIGAHLVKTVKKKNKGGTDIKPSQIKNHLCIFVNCLVENPAFDSQTKECLNTRPKQFGSTCQLSDKFLKQVDKSDIIDMILSFAKFKQDRELKKKGGTKKIKLTGIIKLDDANFAGSAKSKDCTLIITEGDSAKSLAMSGLSIVGRDHYGVFPLRGKPLNVRDAPHTTVMKNEEIKNVVDILGLKHGVTYDETNIKTLRYGHLMIMADQDHDGSHIKGLVINMIHTFWPSLLDVPGFLQQFITPIVKVSKGRASKTFFTLPQYEDWRESTGNDGKGWKSKYYKGLGTSTSAEAKDYFSNLDLHEINFVTLSNDKPEPFVLDNVGMDCDVAPFPDQNISSSGADLIDMVFRKARVEDRKKWLNGLEKDTYLDYSQAQAEGVKYSDFINKELILFSKSDCERSIPHVMDGFKPSQRKVLFACFKRKLKDEVKVAQLAGYIGEHAAYHHGEASLHSTMINMAQSFVGSNNINLLTPSGQFGTRRMGGKDAASPRYIFTKLEKITRAIFHPDDDELLDYLFDDGVSIEPQHYMPVIPFVLVNGSDGIGTGWSSCVNNYDPRVIISNIRRMIRGEPLETMVPHYSGFTGDISLDNKGKFAVVGRIERTNDTTLLISELPIRKWTQDYKTFLEGMLAPDAKGAVPEIKDFRENHTDTTVSFTITAEKENIDRWQALPKGGLYAKFKLTSSLSQGNMHLFNTENKIIKYATAEDILKEFYNLRLEFYDKRKELLLKKLRREQSMLSNKARFVEEVCSGDLVVSNRKKVELLLNLQERGYDLFDKTKENDVSDTDEAEEDTSSTADLAKGYEHLLGMKIWSLTYEKAEELRAQLAERTAELEELEATSTSQIWLNDLDSIEVALDERDIEIGEAVEDEKKAQKKNQKHQASKTKKAAAAKKRGKKKAGGWDSDLDESDEETDSEVEVVKKITTSRRKPAASKARTKPAAKKATVAVAPKVVEKAPEVVDDIELSLAERMRKKLMVSPPAEKVVSRPILSVGTTIPKQPSFSDEDDGNVSGSSKGTKRPSPRSSESDDDEIEVVDSLASASSSRKTTTKATKPQTKRARATTAAKKPAPKKVPAKRGKKKLEEPVDSSDDEFGFDSDSDVVEVIAKPAARSRAARTQTKKITYTLDSDDESECSDSDF